MLKYSSSYNDKLGVYSLVLFFLVFEIITLNAQISGIVYRDLPVNGSNLNTYGFKDINEEGVEGVKINAYPSGLSTFSSSDGSWFLPVTSNVRIEFSNWPFYLKESVSGTVKNTSVQFGNIGDVINFGLHNPSDFQNTNNPQIITSEFISGLPEGGGSAGKHDAWFLFNYLDKGTRYNPANFDVLAKISDVGAIWGQAFQKSTNRAFASATLRRHAGFGPGGTGAIYSSNVSGSPPYSSSLWLDISSFPNVKTGIDSRDQNDPDNALPADAHIPSYDLKAFALVGKMSIGDIDVSSDNKKLYVVNLYEKKLLIIDIATKKLLNNIQIPNPGCSDGDYRPWAVAEHNGEVYVGVTCSAETSQNDEDLAIHVMKLEANTFTSVFSESNMNYNRETSFGLIYNFSPWRLNWNDLSNKGRFPTGDPSPCLTDIEFDKTGAMILLINDMTGFQISGKNYDAVSGSTNTKSEGLAGGDLLRACPDGNGGWIMESNGSCGGVNGANVGNGYGPGGGEFYNDQRLGHKEVCWGGGALLKGAGHILFSGLDPMGDFRSGGVIWQKHSDGKYDGGFEIYDDAGFVGAEFSKTAGIGDVELLGIPAPIEIGNFIWEDINANGVQDPNEAGLINVPIDLLLKGNIIASALTNSQGHYIFSNAKNQMNSSSHIYNISELEPNRAYTISVPNIIAKHSLTIMNFGEGLNRVLNDSNADPTNGIAEISSTAISTNGDNNHSIDIGYRLEPCSIVQSHALECQDNGTPNDFSDDYYNLNILCSVMNGSGHYFVKTGSFTSMPTPTGKMITIIGDGIGSNPKLIANGITSHRIIIHDELSSLCVADFMIEDPFEESDIVHICQGDSVLVFGEYINNSRTLTRQLVSQAGCNYIQSVQVILDPLLQDSTTRFICPGDSVFIFNNWFENEGSYNIYSPNFNDCDSLNKVFIFLLQDKYTYDTISLCEGDTIQVFGTKISAKNDLVSTFQGLNGCDSTAYIHIELLKPKKSSEDHLLCFGDSLLFNGKWIKEAGTLTEKFNAINGCDSVHSIEVKTVLPNSLNFAPLDLLTDTLLFNNEILNIDLGLDPNKWSVLWTPADVVNCDTCMKVQFSPKEDVTISVQLTYHGGQFRENTTCTIASSFFIRIVHEGIYIPNVFSPNDDGINDSWIPLHTPNITLLQLKIYDRWGELVYESLRSNDEKTANLIEVKAWNGRLNKLVLNPAVFAYVVEYLNYRNEVKIAFGDVTLVK